MEGNFLSQGAIIGFSIAAPVGPIGALCVRRTLAKGALFGFVSGLGAATADGIYGAIAGMGLTFLSTALINYEVWIRLLGGIFLTWLGIVTFLSKPHEEATSGTEDFLLGAFASTFVLTLTNPMTILSFTAIFGGLGVGRAAGDYVSAGLLVAGVFLGSSLWWLTLSATVGRFRSRLDRRALRWVNWLAGATITGFGLWAVLSVAR
jgi:threonine/homoserine/homoserine lactone efflux protein